MRLRGLRRSMLVLMGLALVAGCAGTAPPPPAPLSSAPVTSMAPPASMPSPATSPAALPASPPAPPALVAADGTDVQACRDGRCQIEVRAGTSIPFGGRFGVNRLEFVMVGAGSVAYGAASGNGNVAGTSGSVGSTNTVQSLSVTVDAVSGDAAVVTLRPA